MQGNPRSLKLLADVISVASVLFLAAWLLFFALNDFGEEHILDAISNTISYLAFSGIGLLIILRQPKNLIGWVCAIVGFFAFLGLFADEYTAYAYVHRPLPLIEVVAWLLSWTWTIPVLLPTLLLPALFPDGRPLSPRWRYIIWLGVVAIFLAAILASVSVDDSREVTNPLAIDSLQPLIQALGSASFAICGVAFFACVVSALLRFRSSAGQARLQMKWFVYSIPPAVALVLANDYVMIGSGGNFLFGLALTLVITSIGISVLRYRLYEIDLIVNRTLVYGLLTALLAGLYAACVQLFKLLFEGATGETSQASVVLTTLILAATFTPAKAQLQKLVDRYFGQGRDPLKPLQSYVDELRAVMRVFDPSQTAQRFLECVIEAVGVEGAALHLRQGARTILFEEAGVTTGERLLDIPLMSEDVEIGKLRLSVPQNGRDIGEEAQRLLQVAAGLVAAAISLAQRTSSASHEGETAVTL